MNEEEKEAIDELWRFDCCYNGQIKTILNLIEKLQKENEELKNKEVTARKINELLVQRYSNSIPVQKVKDTIDRID